MNWLQNVCDGIFLIREIYLMFFGIMNEIDIIIQMEKSYIFKLAHLGKKESEQKSTTSNYKTVHKKAWKLHWTLTFCNH